MSGGKALVWEKTSAFLPKYCIKFNLVVVRCSIMSSIYRYFPMGYEEAERWKKVK